MSKDTRAQRRELSDTRLKASGLDQALIDKKLKDRRKLRYEGDLMMERLRNFEKDK